jgi:hypothetical protein
MTLKLKLLNALLFFVVALICAAIWKQARDASTARSLLNPPFKKAQFPLPKPLLAISPLSASSYLGVAEGNLLSPDRNPNITVEAPPVNVPSPPPLPLLSGVILIDGFEPTVLLSPRSGAQKHAYHRGETVGDWQIDSFNRQQIMLEWRGNRVTKSLAELMDHSTIAPIPADSKNQKSTNPPSHIPSKPVGQPIQNELPHTDVTEGTGNIADSH